MGDPLDDQGGLGMHYKNAKLDEMLTRIEATDDPKKRAPQYSDVQKLIKDEAPFIFCTRPTRRSG